MKNTEIEIPNMKHKIENRNNKYETQNRQIQTTKYENTTVVDDHFCQVENEAGCVRYQENQH